MKSKPVVTKSRTSMRVVSVEHFWTIEDFSHCHKSASDYLESAPFTLPNDVSGQFFLRIYPKGDGKDGKDYVSVYLHYKPEEEGKEITVGCKFHLIDRMGFKRFPMELKPKQKYEKATGWGFRKYIQQDKIKNPPLIFWPFHVNGGDKVTVHCEVSYITDVSTKALTPEEKSAKCHKSVGKMVKALFQKSKA